MDKLTVKGTRIVDSHGRERILTGLNVCDKGRYIEGQRRIYGEQVLDNRGAHQVAASTMPDTQEPAPGDPTLAHHDWNTSKAQINGSMVHITAIFGFTIGGLVLNDIYTKALA